MSIPIPIWSEVEITGYEPKTTFWQDFSIADAFGTRTIQDTYNRASREWGENLEYFTELVMVLNHKCWAWNNRNEMISQLYAKLYYEAYDKGLERFKGDDLKYYLETLD